MKAIRNKIGVVFDDSHLKTYDLGNGIKLERAESWRGKEGDEESITKVESNVNHLETNPQIGLVVMENDNYSYKTGDKVFMHYLAYEEFEEKIEVDGADCYLIDEGHILFTFNPDGGYNMNSDNHLGEVIIEEPPKTTSGIYLTSQEEVKNDLRIKITHTPMEVENEYGVLSKNICEVGDVVVPIDKSNYPLTVDGKEYVMLRNDEIVGKYATKAEA